MAVKRANTSRRSGSTAAKTRSAKRPAAKQAAKKPVRAAAKAPPKKVAAPSRKAAAPAKLPQAAGGSVADQVGNNIAKNIAKNIVRVVEGALDEMKAVQVKILDVRKLTDIADTLVIASGNSDRHVRSIADRVLEHARKAGFRPTGVEGQRDGEWVLVDLQDVIVHIMLPRVREMYRLENLWDVSAARREAAMEKMAV